MFVSLNVDTQLSFVLGSCLFPSVLDEKNNNERLFQTKPHIYLTTIYLLYYRSIDTIIVLVVRDYM